MTWGKLRLIYRRGMSQLLRWRLDGWLIKRLSTDDIYEAYEMGQASFDSNEKMPQEVCRHKVLAKVFLDGVECAKRDREADTLEADAIAMEATYRQLDVELTWEEVQECIDLGLIEKSGKLLPA